MEKYKLTKPQLQIHNMDRFIGSKASIVCCDIFWEEAISTDKLNDAANTIVRINDSLRIRVDEFEQEVAPYEPFEAESIIFDNYDEYQNFACFFSRKELTDVLFEMKIIQLPNKSGLLVKLHHIISDGFSMSIIANQLCEIINGATPKGYSYIDFIKKEEEYINSVRYQKDRDYFLSKVNSTPERFFINKKLTNSYNSNRYSFVPDKAITSSIKEYTSNNNISEYGFFVSVLAMCFYLYYNAPKRFFVGSTILNRVNDMDKNTVGMCVNTIPVFVELEEKESIISNIENIYYSTLDGIKHQRCNLTDLQTELNKVERKLYDVLFSYHVENIDNSKVSEINYYPPAMQAETLQIHIDDRQNSGCMNINYDYLIDNLTSDDIIKLNNNILSVIKLVLENDKDNLINFNASKSGALLGEKRSLPNSDTVYHTFEHRAKENLNRICILGNNIKATNEEFLKAIYCIDNHLRKYDNKSSCVAIICDRSFEMYCAIYGAIRSGCSIVPISPEYPKERIEFIIEDCRAKAVLCQSKYFHLIESKKMVDISVLLANGEEAPKEILTTLSQTAYIIYTSGSTGKPKGVEISHLSLYNRLMWMQENYLLTEESVVLQKTPYTFDVSMWEIFWWGMYGASLAFSNPGEHFMPNKIVDAIYEYKVTHIHFVPSVFSKFVEELFKKPDSISKIASLKHIFLSGESAIANDINLFYKLTEEREIKIHNLYGPTECTIDVTAYECKKTEADPVPIGLPIYNTMAYVVDENKKPVRDGQKGELIIGGVGVGKGYLNNPSLTSESFIKNPFGDGIVYKTGDIVYINNDNLITFVCRNDSQVKINGQRIEIGEIESIIDKHPKINSSVVLVEKIENTDVLCAYYQGEKLSKEELQKHCKNYLASYMIPKYWYQVCEFPINSNGKCDRNALCGYKSNPCLDEKTGRHPINEQEILICDRFKKILNISYVDMNTDFFLNGGDSLNVIELMAYPEYINVSMAEFMSRPTPEGMLTILNGGEKSKDKLKILHKSDFAKTSVVLFPYAGGKVASFAKLMNTILSKNKDINIFYTDFLHSEDECHALALKIKEIANGTNIVFYSHCVGASNALSVIKILEADNIPVSKFVAGGIVLPKKKSQSVKNPWRKAPGFAVKNIFKTLGAPINKVSKKESDRFIIDFLSDTDYYFDFVGREQFIVNCPTVLMLSKNDVFTMNYKGAYNSWSRYSSNIIDIIYLEKVGHYFQNDAAEEIAKIILG